MKKNNNKVLFISSTGGHFSELMMLKNVMIQYDYHIITEKTKSTQSLKNEYKDKIDFLVYGTREKKFIYPFKFAYNFLKSFVLFLKIRPAVVVTTGTHTAVPMAIITNLFKSKLIYIETYANVTTPTATGRYIYNHNLYTKFIVQWEEMKKIYPDAIYFGGLF